MSMQSTTASVADWFKKLPLSDPRCNNDSCIAYEDAHAASQAAVPYTLQFKYGHWTMWIFAIFIFCYSVYFYSHLLFSKDGVQQRPNPLGKLTAALRWVSYRRIKGTVADKMGLPSLGVCLVVLSGWIATTIMAFAVHPYYRERRGYGSPPLGVRTGLIAFALIPLTFATAGKVNIITLLTGLGHEKLNAFHRHTAYIMLYVSVIHTVPFLAQPYREGGAAGLHARFYRPGGLEYTGTPPLGMLVGLCVLSVPWLRRLAYEIFVQTHLLLSIVYLGLCFWHAKNLGDSWAYLWGTLAIFLVQLLVRVFGKTTVFQFRGEWFCQALVTLAKLEEGMVKLEMDVHGKWTWEPGQHVFLKFVQLQALDNHPFTIACLPDAKTLESTRMVFYIRPQRGLTAKIASSTQTLSATVDGPYGTILRPRPEIGYDTVILVAGGGGFAGMLPHLQHLSRCIASGQSSVKKVEFIWVVRRKESLTWCDADLKECQSLAPGSINLDIWITGEIEKGSVNPISHGKDIESDAASSGSERGWKDLLSSAHVGQRPVMKEVIPKLVNSGRVLVLGCGPESLKIDLSNAVAGLQAKVLKGEVKKVSLHTETFGW
ncbi:hypothetical protein LRP88_14757 [Fusarium phalaenopsidis]